MPRTSVTGWIVGAAVGALVMFVVAPVVVLLLAIGGAGGGQSACDGPGGPSTATGGPRSGTSTVGGGGAGAKGAAGGNQAANAQLITSIVAGRGLPQQAAVDAIATARQESGLGTVGMNVAVDHDSLGLFQQRPSAGWGSPAQVKDPTYATNTFLDHLTRLSGWAAMPVTKAAQAVQGSAFPSAYAQWESMARNLAAKFWPSGTPAAGDPTAPAAAGAAPNAAGAQPCPGSGGDGLPATPPAGATAATAARAAGQAAAAAAPQQAAAVKTALAQLGKPYQWGGTGPAAFDCSGLVQAAWKAAGVTLPRTAAAQAGFGAPVAGVAAAQPGDLIFIPGAGGSPAAPGHVGMYLGNGQLVDAPDVGRPVEIAPVAKWTGKIVGIRRPGTTNPDVVSHV